MKATPTAKLRSTNAVRIPGLNLQISHSQAEDLLLKARVLGIIPSQRDILRGKAQADAQALAQLAADLYCSR